jgi:hypothetical protein
MAMVQDDLTKLVSITGTGFLYYKHTGELTDVHFSVSHRISRSVTAMTFALTFRSPSGVVLKTDRHRHRFQWEYQSKLVGTPLAAGEVYQVQYSCTLMSRGSAPVLVVRRWFTFLLWKRSKTATARAK